MKLAFDQRLKGSGVSCCGLVEERTILRLPSESCGLVEDSRLLGLLVQTCRQTCRQTLVACS